MVEEAGTIYPLIKPSAIYKITESQGQATPPCTPPATQLNLVLNKQEKGTPCSPVSIAHRLELYLYQFMYICGRTCTAWMWCNYSTLSWYFLRTSTSMLVRKLLDLSSVQIANLQISTKYCTTLSQKSPNSSLFKHFLYSVHNWMSANLIIFLSRQICGFAICETDSRTASPLVHYENTQRKSKYICTQGYFGEETLNLFVT